MSVGIATRPEWGELTGGRRMEVFTNGGVDAGVQIVWHLPAPDDEVISILFGAEQITLDFHDVESLERLRDVADQAAARLRMVIEAKARVDTAGPAGWSAELVGGAG